jgi:hypothetical protein
VLTSVPNGARVAIEKVRAAITRELFSGLRKRYSFLLRGDVPHDTTICTERVACSPD